MKNARYFRIVAMLLIIVGCCIILFWQYKSQELHFSDVAVQHNAERYLDVKNAFWAYCKDHHDHFPDADHWEDAIRPYWKGRGPFSTEVYFSRDRRHYRFAMSKVFSNSPTVTSDSLAGSQDIVMYVTLSDHKNTNGVAPSLTRSSDNYGVICGNGVFDADGWGCNQYLR